MQLPKITIVTPNFNGDAFLEQTISSVLSQNYPNLEYMIIDGGSTDNSLSIIKKYSHQLSYWVTEPDNGMYDAIQKGFNKSTGEIMGWLNSDDMLHPNSLFQLAKIFNSNPNVDWMEGVNTLFDVDGHTTFVHLPKNRDLYYYLLKLQFSTNFGYIQQESTYWRRNLWNKVGATLNTKMKFAGDYDLWMRFFLYADLYTLTTLVGGFRNSSQYQLSVLNENSYYQEVLSINDQILKRLSKSELKQYKKHKVILKVLNRIPNLNEFLVPYYLNNQFKSKVIS